MTRRELIGALTLTAITLLPLCVWGYLYYMIEAERVAMGRPPPPPNDPNIGLGILQVLACINIPTILLWGLMLCRHLLRTAQNGVAK